MAILIKIKKRVEPFIPFKGFQPVAHEFIPLGAPVQVIALRWGRNKVGMGDIGVVELFMPATGRDKNPDDDLYQVKFGETRVHMYFNELKRV